MNNKKKEMFIKVAEARTNKVIEVIRSLSNCSKENIYEYNSAHVEKIFNAIQKELDIAKDMFLCKTKKFSISNTCLSEQSEYPYIDLTFPDGSTIRATAVDDENFPAINIDLLKDGNDPERICFVEFNQEKESGKELCIGVYKEGEDDNSYYQSYNQGTEGKDDGKES